MKPTPREIVLEATDGRRRRATLGGRAGPPGSQGSVWRVVEWPRLVVKLERRPDADRFPQKLEVMLRSRPEQLTARDGIIRVAWPLGRVRDARGGRLLGYVQPALLQPGFASLHHAFTGHGSLVPADATWRWYLELALDLARTMSAIHRAGHVVADLSPENLFATAGATVAFVDVDGWQIHDPRGGTPLPSPFSRDEYTPPEHLADPASRKERRFSADRWALSVLIAVILQLGTHPFAGIPPGAEPPYDVRANVEARRAVLLGTPLRPPPSAPRAGLVLAGPLGLLLRRCLDEGYDDPEARPRPEEWIDVLAEAQYEIRRCPTGPLHVHLPQAVRCPWCELAARTGRDRFPLTRHSSGRHFP
ncbi:hypothetical protein [Streptomyces sp. NPDC007905]|uniref:hypothetical protein n=1 Tax=Streptomyces sp. NPDC007905 TaxID=3364788 RepID=UPI0036EF8482